MNKLSLVIISGLMMGLASMSFAQNSANANATANASVVKPIKLTWNQPLAFGNLTTPTVAATSMMDVNGVNVTNSGYYAKNPTNTNCNSISNGVNIYGGDGSPGPAIFTVNGQLNFTFIVTLPTGSTPVPIHLANNTQASADLLLDNLTCCVGGQGGVPGLTGTLSNGTGNQWFAVGGTLHIPAAAPSGWYQGTFDVAVSYN
jgi:hypothetical protein